MCFYWPIKSAVLHIGEDLGQTAIIPSCHVAAFLSLGLGLRLDNENCVVFQNFELTDGLGFCIATSFFPFQRRKHVYVATREQPTFDHALGVLIERLLKKMKSYCVF
jgi:hypothetical protein